MVHNNVYYVYIYGFSNIFINFNTPIIILQLCVILDRYFEWKWFLLYIQKTKHIYIGSTARLKFGSISFIIAKIKSEFLFSTSSWILPTYIEEQNLIKISVYIASGSLVSIYSCYIYVYSILMPYHLYHFKIFFIFCLEKTTNTFHAYFSIYYVFIYIYFPKTELYNGWITHATYLCIQFSLLSLSASSLLLYLYLSWNILMLTTSTTTPRPQKNTFIIYKPNKMLYVFLNILGLFHKKKISLY